MCNLYIVPDRQKEYNKAILREGVAFCDDTQRGDDFMPASKAQQRAVSKYMKANYDEIKVRVSKGQKDVIQAHSEATGESVNGFINRAITFTMEADKAAVGDSKGV